MMMTISQILTWMISDTRACSCSVVMPTSRVRAATNANVSRTVMVPYSVSSE